MNLPRQAPARLHRRIRLDRADPLRSRLDRRTLLASAALLILAGSACSGTPAATPTLVPPPTDTPEPEPTATETVPTATPTPQATAVAADSGDFISPYTPSAPVGSGATLDPIVLRLIFEEGAVYRIRMLQNQSLSQTFEGQTFDISQKFGYEYTYTVTGMEPDGSSWIDIEYTRALYQTETPFGTESYDSANPPGAIPEGAEGIAAIVGSGFSIKIGLNGQILEVDGLDEMYAQMLSELDPAMRQLIESTLEAQFGEEALKDQLGNFFFEFPEDSLQVGDSWSSSEETAAMLPIAVDSTYTLQSFDEDTALIEVVSSISTGSMDETLDLDLFAFDFTLTGVQEGLIEIDLKTGLTNSIVEQTLTGEMTIEAEGEEVTVPLSIVQTIQVESAQIAP